MEIALVSYHCGKFDTTKHHAETWLSIGTEHALTPCHERAAVALARLRVDEGRSGEALRLLEAKLLTPASVRTTSGCTALCLAAETYARAGEPEKGLELRAALLLARPLAPCDRGPARDALAVVDWFTEGADVADLRNARALREQLS
jgi:hypothetical protein